MNRDLFRSAFEPAPYTYSGDRLREIAMPIGGIGTGCVSLDGRGGFRDWEIYGRPNKHSLLKYTVPFLWCREEGEAPRAMTVQGPRVRDFVGEAMGFWGYGHGQFFQQLDGLPGFSAVEFVGTYPFARLRFLKPSLPLTVELVAFNPLIPLDTRSSSFPLVALVYRLENVSDRPVEYTMALNLLNPVTHGVDGEREDAAWNRYRAEDGLAGIEFGNDRFAPEDPRGGTVLLATDHPDPRVWERWPAGEWFDPLQTFWNRFAQTGELGNGEPAGTGVRMPGTVGGHGVLAPGESAEVRFVVAWRFPISSKYWGDDAGGKGSTWTPWYAKEWPDVWSVGREFFDRREELTQRTLAFEEALYDSTLPTEVIESVGSTLSILRTPTLLRLDDGTFWGWEGCSPNEGCCEGTCSHVWNYALTHAYLFPEIQQSFRETDYKHNFNCGPQGAKGALIFRTMIPLGREAQLWHAASDGQLGGIVQLFRDWRLTGDEAFLARWWPSAKRALEFAWVQWDRDRDGLVDGDQHNTYDINFQGPNPLTQFFYLAALRAGEAIARHLGDGESSETYRGLYERGRALTEERLFNGEFFVQTDDCLRADAPKYQHGVGCLSDQVFGQLAAEIAGLGDLVDRTFMSQALDAIYAHNFRDPLGDHVNLQRVYALADESGLLLCSWPNGGRPAFPFVYSDEVWTGIEYQVASHLAYHGRVEECLAIVRGIRQRYDGSRRNPYNEFECGSHYARALPSYGVWLGLTGFRYDAVEGYRNLEPRIPGPMRCFYATPHAWGVATHEGGKTTFTAYEGELPPTEA